ncbi:unnamed protein product, partial [Trichogramma brassicae]
MLLKFGKPSNCRGAITKRCGSRIGLTRMDLLALHLICQSEHCQCPLCGDIFQINDEIQQTVQVNAMGQRG